MQLLNDIENSWSDLGGNNVIDSFEQGWYEWNINDTVEWFKFTLNMKNVNGINSNDYEIENYNSDSSSDDMNENHDQDDEKKVSEMNDDESNIDFKGVESNLLSTEFNAKKYFPILLKPFQFKQFGFKNKQDQKFLCAKVKQLIAKYPKKKKKTNKKNDNYKA